MSITNLNVCVGIDAGSNTSKLAYDSKLIAELENFDALKLREEAEIYFDEPIFSCVIAVPESYNRRQCDDVIYNAKKSGFKNVTIITAHEAINMALNYESSLVYDFGATKSELTLHNGDEVLESVIIEDVSGNEFDKVFAEWLSERFTLDLIDKKVLCERAEAIKISLSENDYVTWRDVNIYRDDLERLIYFTIKRAAHVAKRLMTVYKPESFILTGGCAKIPLVRKVFMNMVSDTIEINESLIANGASLKAASLVKSNVGAEKLNTATKIRELRGRLIELEESLTRKQKDRLYLLFRQAEGINDPKIIALMENLISEIKEAI